MANRLNRGSKFLGLPDNVMVEVIAYKSSKSFKQIMTVKDAAKVKKIKGWTYRTYQLGYSAFNNVQKQ